MNNHLPEETTGDLLAAGAMAFGTFMAVDGIVAPFSPALGVLLGCTAEVAVFLLVMGIAAGFHLTPFTGVVQSQDTEGDDPSN